MDVLANTIGLKVPYFGFRLFNFIQRRLNRHEFARHSPAVRNTAFRNSSAIAAC